MPTSVLKLAVALGSAALAAGASVEVGADGAPVKNEGVPITITNNKKMEVDVYWEDKKLFSVEAGKEMSINSFEGHTFKLKRAGDARTIKTCVVNSGPTQCTAGKSDAAAELVKAAVAKASLADRFDLQWATRELTDSEREATEMEAQLGTGMEASELAADQIDTEVTIPTLGTIPRDIGMPVRRFLPARPRPATL